MHPSIIRPSIHCPAIHHLVAHSLSYSRHLDTEKRNRTASAFRELAVQWCSQSHYGTVRNHPSSEQRLTRIYSIRLSESSGCLEVKGGCFPALVTIKNGLHSFACWSAACLHFLSGRSKERHW
jgi:hypothetical protein